MEMVTQRREFKETVKKIKEESEENYVNFQVL